MGTSFFVSFRFVFLSQIWVLTGDKLETAVNIAYSCGHFKRAMELLELSHQTEEANTTGRVLTGFL